jgi:hypothetical protein
VDLAAEGILFGIMCVAELKSAFIGSSIIRVRGKECTMSIQEIVREFRALSLEERKNVLKLLIDTLMEPTTEKTHLISEFQGIAAILADKEDRRSMLIACEMNGNN